MIRVAFRRMIGKRDDVWIMKTPPFSGPITLPGLLCLGMTGRGRGDTAVSPPVTEHDSNRPPKTAEPRLVAEHDKAHSFEEGLTRARRRS